MSTSPPKWIDQLYPSLGFALLVAGMLVAALLVPAGTSLERARFTVDRHPRNEPPVLLDEPIREPIGPHAR